MISLGIFAKGAKDGALFHGAAPITLIDGKRLLELCKKHEVGVSVGRSKSTKLMKLSSLKNLPTMRSVTRRSFLTTRIRNQVHSLLCFRWPTAAPRNGMCAQFAVTKETSLGPLWRI
jgi:hypothetical protein